MALTTVGNTFIPCPPINHNPTNSIPYDFYDTTSEPFFLKEANPTAKGSQNHFSEAWHSIPVTDSSSADVEFQWAAQDSIPVETQVPQYPTAHNNDADTSFQLSIPNKGTPSSYGKLQPCNNSNTKERRRQRNSLAARKYRQKHLDRITELEQALVKTEKERDGLRVQLECWKTKAELLQELTAGLRGSGCMDSQA
ncbi:hypothetical protein MMC08_006550 [Hypocenomyce scalaris]|nr:hypothetical protein [Hypocenomyce scalaris]